MKSTPETIDTSEEGKILRVSQSYRQEAEQARRYRMDQNKVNFDAWNLKGNFAHKKTGQSREFLPRQSMSIEQIASFMHQALMDMGDWFTVEAEPGVDTGQMKIQPEEITLLLRRQLEKTKFDEVLEDSLKLGLLGALMPSKVYGTHVNKPQFYTKQEIVGNKVKTRLYNEPKKIWQLKISTFRHEDYYPDPTGSGLYEMQQIEMDLHEMYAMAEGDDAIYDKNVVKQITTGFDSVDQEAKKAHESGQNITFSSYRKRVRIQEFWGNVIDPETGELMYENVVWTIANERFLIQKPTPNPLWHGDDPFVVTPVTRTPHSVWHKTIMDAGTQLNLALNELYNLMLDTGLMAAFGVRQVREEWLSDPTQISDGIGPTATLFVNDSCPPGGKVVEPLQTAIMTPEVNMMFQSTSAELNQATLTNDLRMGSLPERAVKATEVVEASQSITSVFTGLAKIIENNHVSPTLRKSWMTMCQNMDDLDSDEVAALIGKERALEIAALSPAERFASTAQGIQFRVFGITLTLNKMKEFKKITALLQTIAGSEPMIEEFIKKYDFGKLLALIMKSLDINPKEIEIDETQKAAMMMGQQPQEEGATQMGSQPDVQSNIPQIGSMGDGSAFPQADFPGSSALQVQQ